MNFMRRKLTGKEKGFTLVELLVVISLMAILITAAVPILRSVGGAATVLAQTELDNVQEAVTALRADQKLQSVTAVSAATNNMAAFPTGTPLYGGATNYIQKATTRFYYKVTAAGVVSGFYDAAGVQPIQ